MELNFTNFSFKSIAMSRCTDRDIASVHSRLEALQIMGFGIDDPTHCGFYKHSLYVAEAMKIMARILHLDEEGAEVLGFMHDYGRKYTNQSNGLLHSVVGFEHLVNLGWYAEARACLTHSFIDGMRPASLEPVIPEFYVDASGVPVFKCDKPYDDVNEFLANCKYDIYDDLLNIADLVATGDGIVNPYDRVQDVLTRRPPECGRNKFFYITFTNKMMQVLELMGDPLYKGQNLNYHDETLETSIAKFKDVSNEFEDFVFYAV